MKFKYLPFLYLLGSFIGIWFLTKFWLPAPYAIAGHDSGLALDTRQFLQTRFFAWNEQGFGQDNSPHFGSIILHSIDFLVSWLAKVPYAGNQLLLFFWIFLIFLSAFIFSYSFRKKLGVVFSFIFPILLTFNFLVIQSLFIIERAKYSQLVAALLLSTIYFKLRERKISLFLSTAISSLILFIFNSGSWLGLPLYGSLAILVISALVFETIVWATSKSFTNLGRLLGWLSLTGLAFLVLSSYSILPYVANFLTSDYVSLARGASINKDWLALMSQASSFLNIFRLQGIPDWYAGSYTANISHSYAEVYLTNPFFIVLSFIFPATILSSFLLTRNARQKMIVGFSGLVFIISMFFVGGSHPPLGFIYEFIFQYLPGFAIFRSPYFKFGSALIFSTSILMAFTVTRLGAKVKAPRALIYVLAILVWMSYHFVLFQKDTIFYWQKGYSTKLKIPEYVYSFRDWFLENKEEGKILLLPPLNDSWRNDAYSWGYWSLSTLPSLLTSTSVLVNDSNLFSEEKGWLDELYLALREGKEQTSYEVMNRLGVKFLLLRNDVLADDSWSATSSPEIYRVSLDNLSQIVKVQTFREWELYKLGESSPSKFSAVSELSVVPPQYSYLGRELIKKDHFVIKGVSADLSQFSSEEIRVYECQSCVLERKGSLDSLPRVTILPNSPLYYLKVLRERKALKAATTDSSKADAYLGFVLRRAAEVKTMLDFSIAERFIIGNLESMNSYLEAFYEITSATSVPDDYGRARVFLDSINPVKKNLREYVSSSDFGKKSEKLRQEMLDVLWQIYELESFYSILADKDVLEREKIYNINAIEGDFLIDTSTLPQGPGNMPLFPKEIIYSTQEAEKPLSMGETKDDWTILNFPKSISDPGKLILRFPEPENLFVVEKTTIEQSPTGTRACYLGKINDFDKNKRYLVKVSVTKKDQSLRLFFKETSRQKGRGSFLHGEDEVDIDPILSYEPFRYIYYPSVVAAFSNVYLCSGNKELPVVDEIEIHKIFSPVIVATTETVSNQENEAELRYEKINPTSYSVTIKAAKQPFILFFNERFHPMWRLFEKNLSGDLSDYRSANNSHFTIDGYANGWIIDKKGDYQLILEFLPQRYFKSGIFVSLVGLVSALSVIFYFTIKKML